MKDLEQGWVGQLTSFWEVRSRRLGGEWSGDIRRGTRSQRSCFLEKQEVGGAGGRGRGKAEGPPGEGIWGACLSTVQEPSWGWTDRKISGRKSPMQQRVGSDREGLSGRMSAGRWGGERVCR